MTMLWMLDHLSIRQKQEKKPPHPGNPEYPDQPPQPPVPIFVAEMVVLLKYLSNFQKSLNSYLIDCEIEVDQSRIRDYVLLIDNNDNTTGVNFVITSTELHVAITLCSFNNKWQHLIIKSFKKGFQRTIFWNKCKSESQHDQKITIQIK